MRPINLLPPEVGRERSRRRRAALWVLAGVAYLLLLAVGMVYWDGKVAAARDEVRDQEAINQGLEAEVVALGDSAAVRDTFEEKADLVREALEADVDWGILLNDLARLMPPRVWVETFNGSVVPQTIPGVVGQVSFSGIGFDFPDVSEWLRTLESDQFAGVTGPWVTTVNQGVVGPEQVVTFSSIAALTRAAITDRAETLIPEVP